jgi:thioredoxin:protein disulfide reductase
MPRFLFLLLLGAQACLAAGPLDDLLGSGAATEESRFLSPDQAFMVDLETAPGEVRANFRVAPGYYLYRDRLQFKVASDPSPLGPPEVPTGKDKVDPEFGTVQAMMEDFAVRLPAQGEARGPVQIELTYQGCAEAGLCYPPVKRLFDVVLDTAVKGAAAVAVLNPVEAATAASPANTGGAAAASADALASRIGKGSALSTLALFLGLGLLLSLTPCVFPMVPILSGILVGQDGPLSTARGFWIAAAYVLAMSSTYAIAGVITASLGGNVQAALQHPVILVSFAAVFVALALSMFGYWDLQLPGSWQTRLSGLSARHRGGSLRGAAVMGSLSALIVGPCVAPPLVGALLYIANSGNAAFGGAALFCLGLGMGLPLLLLGASAGHLLPRAGRWMEEVKHIFGVLMLGVAWWLLERLLPGPVVLAGWAALLVVFGVYLGAVDGTYDGETGPARVRRGAGVLALLCGAALLLGAAAGGDDPLRPLATLGGPGPSSGMGHAPLPFRPVASTTELERELESARAAGEPVMLDFYADWCVECKRMERTTFRDSAVRASLQGFRLLKADVTRNTAADRELMAALGLYGPPATLFYTASSGEELRRLRLTGYAESAELQQHLADVVQP